MARTTTAGADAQILAPLTTASANSCQQNPEAGLRPEQTIMLLQRPTTPMSTPDRIGPPLRPTSPMAEPNRDAQRASPNLAPLRAAAGRFASSPVTLRYLRHHEQGLDAWRFPDCSNKANRSHNASAEEKAQRPLNFTPPGGTFSLRSTLAHDGAANC